MKYILIFIAISTHFPPYTITAEFDDKPACEAAMKAVRDNQRYTFEREPHSAYIMGSCFPKASK